MCAWGDCVEVLVPIPARLSHTGRFRWDKKRIDRCIAQLVQDFNDCGMLTANSCCGHGQAPAKILFHDGTTLLIHNFPLASRPLPCYVPTMRKKFIGVVFKWTVRRLDLESILKLLAQADPFKLRDMTNRLNQSANALQKTIDQNKQTN